MRLRTGLTGKRRGLHGDFAGRGAYMRKSPKCTPGRTRRPVCQKVPTDGGDQATGADPGAIVDPCRVVGFPWSEEGNAADFPAPPPPLYCFVSGVVSAGHGVTGKEAEVGNEPARLRLDPAAGKCE